MGFNFSVAVTVGYIGLFGIVVETAVVMIIFSMRRWICGSAGEH
jgi:Cu/Ag efflux pump CusA